MLPNQLATPPTDMVMSPHYSLILTVNFVLFAMVLLWVINDSRKSRRVLPLMILLGAMVASLQECLYDVFCNVWYAQYGATPMYRIFNISVPLWMLPAYGWYIGGLGYFMYKKFRDGITAGQVWKLYALFWVANLLLEVPALQIGNIYAYYGNQPFELLGFPVWMAATNSLPPILFGITFSALDDVLRGPRAIFAVAIAPMIVGAGEMAAGWPMFLALNSGVGVNVTRAAALVTLALSLLVTYLATLKFVRPATATARERQPLGQSLPLAR